MVFLVQFERQFGGYGGGGVMYNTLETVVFPLPVEAPDDTLVSCRVNTNLAPLFRSYQQISPDPKEGSCRNS